MAFILGPWTCRDGNCQSKTAMSIKLRRLPSTETLAKRDSLWLGLHYGVIVGQECPNLGIFQPVFLRIESDPGLGESF